MSRGNLSSNSFRMSFPNPIKMPFFLYFQGEIWRKAQKKSNFNFQMRRKGLVPVFSMLVTSALKPCYVILVFVTLILTMVEMVKGHEDHLRTPYNKDIWKLRHSQHQHER